MAHVAVVLPQISKYAKFSVCTTASKSAHLLGRPSPPGRSTSTGLEGVTKEWYLRLATDTATLQEFLQINTACPYCEVHVPPKRKRNDHPKTLHQLISSPSPYVQRLQDFVHHPPTQQDSKCPTSPGTIPSLGKKMHPKILALFTNSIFGLPKFRTSNTYFYFL